MASQGGGGGRTAPGAADPRDATGKYIGISDPRLSDKLAPPVGGSNQGFLDSKLE